MSQVREKLEQSQNKVKALEAEEQRLKAEEEQRRQERDEAWGRTQALLQQLENAEVGPGIPEKSLENGNLEPFCCSLIWNLFWGGLINGGKL